VSTSSSGGVVLPDEVSDSITAAAQEPLPSSNQPVPQIMASALPGGVSAMPIDASTYLQVVIPPNPTYFLASSQITVTVNARILNADGTLNYCSWPQTFKMSNGLSFTSNLAPGYLLSVSITCDTNNVADGVLYAVAGLIHQEQTGIPVDTLLVASYVSTYQPAGWPSGILRTVSDGNGFALQVQAANPSVGDDALYTSPDQQEEISALQFTITTSATAATRQAYLEMSNPGTGSVIIGYSPVTQTAGQTVTYAFARNLPASAAVSNQIQYCTLAEGVILNLGGVIIIDAFNLQSGDQISNIYVAGRAWL